MTYNILDGGKNREQYLKKCWVGREPKSIDFASDHYPLMAEFDFMK
jgi:hypothetical protein